MTAWGLMAGLGGVASHGSVILSRGRLVTVEALGLPRHPSSIQHDAVVNNALNVISFVSLKESSFEETPDEESSDDDKEDVSECNCM